MLFLLVWFNCVIGVNVVVLLGWMVNVLRLWFILLMIFIIVMVFVVLLSLILLFSILFLWNWILCFVLFIVLKWVIILWFVFCVFGFKLLLCENRFIDDVIEFFCSVIFLLCRIGILFMIVIGKVIGEVLLLVFCVSIGIFSVSLLVLSGWFIVLFKVKL